MAHILNNTNNLNLNGIIIESRQIDKFINATQLCKAGGKKFNHWTSLDSTKELIKTLERDLNFDAIKSSQTSIKNKIPNAVIPVLKLIDVKVGGMFPHSDYPLTAGGIVSRFCLTNCTDIIKTNTCRKCKIVLPANSFGITETGNRKRNCKKCSS